MTRMRKMEASPETETEISAPAKRKMSRQSWNLIASIIVLCLIVIALPVLFSRPGDGPPEPFISFTESTNSTVYTWTITAIGGNWPLKSDFYVQLKGDGSAVFIIATESLINASGTHGFKYTPASSGIYLAVGDVFSLSKDYSQGTTIALVSAEATSQYYIFTV